MCLSIFGSVLYLMKGATGIYWDASKLDGDHFVANVTKENMLKSFWTI